MIWSESEEWNSIEKILYYKSIDGCGAAVIFFCDIISYDFFDPPMSYLFCVDFCSPTQHFFESVILWMRRVKMESLLYHDYNECAIKWLFSCSILSFFIFYQTKMNGVGICGNIGELIEKRQNTESIITDVLFRARSLRIKGGFFGLVVREIPYQKYIVINTKLTEF